MAITSNYCNDRCRDYVLDHVIRIRIYSSKLNFNDLYYNLKHIIIHSIIILKAPTSMKSLLAAVNLLTVAFGNLMVVIVSEVRYFENQVRKNHYNCIRNVHKILNMGAGTLVCLDFRTFEFKISSLITYARCLIILYK